MNGEPETIEGRALAAAAPMESARFLVESDTLSDFPGPNIEENPTSVTVGEKVGVMTFFSPQSYLGQPHVYLYMLIL